MFHVASNLQKKVPIQCPIYLKRSCWGQWFGTFFFKLDKVKQTFWDQVTFSIYTSWFQFWLSIELFIYRFIVFISSQKKVRIQAWVLFVFCSKTNLQNPYRENGSWRADQETSYRVVASGKLVPGMRGNWLFRVTENYWTTADRRPPLTWLYNWLRRILRGNFYLPFNLQILAVLH